MKTPPPPALALALLPLLGGPAVSAEPTAQEQSAVVSAAPDRTEYPEALRSDKFFVSAMRFISFCHELFAIAEDKSLSPEAREKAMGEIMI